MNVVITVSFNYDFLIILSFDDYTVIAFHFACFLCSNKSMAKKPKQSIFMGYLMTSAANSKQKGFTQFACQIWLHFENRYKTKILLIYISILHLYMPFQDLEAEQRWEWIQSEPQSGEAKGVWQKY